MKKTKLLFSGNAYEQMTQASNTNFVLLSLTSELTML